MAIQDFVTGQVLTAGQMDALQANDYNQTVSAKVASYVLVAADKGTRVTMSNAGATTITVNTSLFAAGDTLFITNIGAGACTITAGTATVSTASSLVLAQYDSGRLYFTSTGVAIWEKYQGAAAASSNGLTLIKTASFSAVTDTGTTFDGVFTSTYSTYLVEIAWRSSANAEFYYKVRSGTTTYSTNYESNRIKYDSVNTFRSDQVTTQVQFGNGEPNIGSFVSMTISPALAASQRTLGNWQSFAINSGASFVGSFQQASAVNHDGFILSAASGNITGTAWVYGMAKS